MRDQNVPFQLLFSFVSLAFPMNREWFCDGNFKIHFETRQIERAGPLCEFSGYPHIAPLDFFFLCQASPSIISSLVLQTLFPDDS